MTERQPDQDWLDALAGRDGAANEEARRLREGILARAVLEPPFVPEVDARREDELVARARRAGLLPAARRSPFVRWQGIAALALAASVLVVVGFLMRPAAPPPPEAVRSAPGGIVRIEARGAHDLQHRIADELSAAGVAPTLYDRLGSFGLDADLPSPVPEGVAAVLKRHRIPVPEDGVLKVEIVEPPRR